MGARGRESVLSGQPTGLNPLNHRDDLEDWPRGQSDSAASKPREGARDLEVGSPFDEEEVEGGLDILGVHFGQRQQVHHHLPPARVRHHLPPERVRQRDMLKGHLPGVIYHQKK